MKKTKHFISQNKESFEIYGGFEDYDVLFKAIENKTTTDHCIEACKALIEGISKTVLMKVDLRALEIMQYLDEQQQDNLRMAIEKIKSNTIEFPFVFKQAATVLSVYHQGFEKNFIFKTGNSFCSFIGGIRNKNGDVSHGRIAPRKDKSSMDLAHMVEQITDVLALHMLEIFSLIDFTRIDEVDTDKCIEESFVYKTEDQLEEIPEEEAFIRGFNDTLDNDNPLDGKLRYSLALYQQSYEDYQIQLEEYRTEQEEQEEEL